MSSIRGETHVVGKSTGQLNCMNYFVTLQSHYSEERAFGKSDNIFLLGAHTKVDNFLIALWYSQSYLLDAIGDAVELEVVASYFRVTTGVEVIGGGEYSSAGVDGQTGVRNFDGSNEIVEILDEWISFIVCDFLLLGLFGFFGDGLTFMHDYYLSTMISILLF